MSTRFERHVAAILTLALLAAGGCGRKTRPLVPDSPRPEIIKELKAVTRDTAAVLSWPIPNRNVEGKSMGPGDIERFRIYRAEIGRDQKRARYRLLTEIDMANPTPAEVRGNMVIWTDKTLKYGLVYGYRVRALSARGGVSLPSTEVRISPLRSLAMPKGLIARGADSSNVITWEPVTTRMDGSQYDGFVGYNLYRTTEQGRYEESPLNKEPLRTPSYKDAAVAINKAYYYMVRSVDSPALPWHESPDSNEATATPRDLSPPDRPTGLTVVPGVNRAFLTWNENKERDLAGYYVYRSLKSGRDFERITEKKLTRTIFSDDTAKSGFTYYYAVTAVDQTGNESARSEEKKASLEKMR